MTTNEVLTKYPKLIKVLQEAGIRTRADVERIEVEQKVIKHKLHFIGEKSYDSNVINFLVYVKGNRLKVKTTDFFKTYNFEWDEEI